MIIIKGTRGITINVNVNTSEFTAESLSLTYVFFDFIR